MIDNLQGIHETVDYKADTQICLYYNEEAENYPPHGTFFRSDYACY